MTQQDHSQRAHALLSASKAERWLNCTPSAKLEEKWIKKYGKQSSAYADEGTLAHELAENILSEHLGTISPDQALLLKESLIANPLHTEEMDGFVEVYTDFVKNRAADLAEAAGLHTKEVLTVEAKSDFSDVVPEGSGIADAIIFSGTTLEVIDLKYGKGVRVEVEGNPQLRLYAWGIYQKLCLSYDIQEIRMTIIQPRLENFATSTMKPEELEAWVNDVVVPRAKLAWKGKGGLVPGDYCKFCQVKPKCAALANLAYEVAKQEFKPGEPYDTEEGNESILSDEKLAEMAEKFPRVEEWIAAARAYMLQQALKGKAWPGMKLVESRTIRKWTDEQKARSILIAEGYEESEFTNTKMKGIGDIEKLVGKKEFSSLLGECVNKPKGDPTLVPESDKREALPASEVSSAVIDFDDLM